MLMERDRVSRITLSVAQAARQRSYWQSLSPVQCVQSLDRGWLSPTCCAEGIPSWQDGLVNVRRHRLKHAASREVSCCSTCRGCYIARKPARNT